MDKDAPLIYTQDRLIRGIIRRMVRRAEDGVRTYGGTMEEADKPVDEWIVDAQEELWDAIVYLEKIRIDYADLLTEVKQNATKKG